MEDLAATEKKKQHIETTGSEQSRNGFPNVLVLLCEASLDNYIIRT